MISAAMLAGCAGSNSKGGAVDMSAADMGGPVIEGEHGRLVDYFSNMPLAGLTVTDGSNSVTTAPTGPSSCRRRWA